MILNELQSWEMRKRNLNALKNIGFYRYDAELRDLIQQAEDVLAQIDPSPMDYLKTSHEMQWDVFRSLDASINARIKADAALNKILIVYHSIYKAAKYSDGRELGCKEEYARELSNALYSKKFRSDSRRSKNLKADELKDYPTVIFCCDSYFGAKRVVRVIARYAEQLRDKKVVLFTCGSANANFFNKTRPSDKILSPEIKERLKIFHVRSGVFNNSDTKIFDPVIDHCSQDCRIAP